MLHDIKKALRNYNPILDASGAEFGPILNEKYRKL